MKATASPWRDGLKRCQLFSTLDEAELESVASIVSERRHEAGEVIFNEGDAADELLVVQEGKIALQMTLPSPDRPAGRRITIDTVSTDEIVGWSAVVEPHIYTLSGICLQPSKLLAVNGDKLRWLFQDDRALGYEVLKELIKTVASRLDDTRRVLMTERALV